MPPVADNFVFLLTGARQPDGGRAYGPVFEQLLVSETDLIFLETGLTSRATGTPGVTFFTPDQMLEIRSADTDGDGHATSLGMSTLALRTITGRIGRIAGLWTKPAPLLRLLNLISIKT